MPISDARQDAYLGQRGDTCARWRTAIAKAREESTAAMQALMRGILAEMGFSAEEAAQVVLELGAAESESAKLTVAPTLTGTAKVGQKLKASNGTWEAAPGAAITSYEYIWRVRTPEETAKGEVGGKLEDQDGVPENEVLVTGEMLGCEIRLTVRPYASNPTRAVGEAVSEWTAVVTA